ncbi:Methionyl/Valyl/Leucyl/Isoleucyl-tRNA synthetase anticodon-binding [Arabidopsis thaliana x Arabidopsis arenosa]|uniref:isoleucine--tRNA ligase n=1 Tax=Arabidopsis thaliana x Arabidopsis arenosa TaxID=1240361 RepID=A0A8T1Z1T5_9BRAS|nr:Methionyl/Valyl/Leucyl/Isoleucyl-tRNA synthetase anticodon-binding [Arabidopsis thaliana x Arabidopsis arenosa]
MEEVCEGKEFSFPRQEEDVLSFWNEIDAFKTQLKRTENLPEYIFYDGPPFATGLPHYGHILAGTIKDIVTRYQSMNGHHVTRRFGWDCHGLPVENEIDRKLNIKRRDEVIKMGIDKYNEECRSIVTRYVGEWEKVITRTGRWIDFKNDYKTMDLPFMESVWWVFAQLWDKNLVYRGFKVMPYSTGCKTPLSNFEAGQNYKEVPDPEIMVTFPVIGDQDNAAFVAWTTTPWTLPSNLALCVNAKFVYVKVRNKNTGKVYVVAESRLSALPTDKPKAKLSNGPAGDTKKANPKAKGAKPESAADSYEVLEKINGASLVGKKYEPLFDYFSDFSSEAFRVVADDYVTDDSGTGIVHCAPAFGEDDYRVCLLNKIIKKGENLVVAVDDDGLFTERITHFSGRYVKDADKDIIEAVKAKGRLVKTGSFTHSYPFCWRSDTPLIYRAVPSWFVRVEQLKEKLLKSNDQTEWVPDYVKDKRFHNWLENARDWAISRSRFWGTPLPIWISDDGEEVVVMDSVEKLEKLSGVKVFDLHRHHIDHITIPSSRGHEFGVLRRVEDVFDCWFESGSMPYAYIHYPFENKELFENNFPGHFVAEGLDQTRGWFYTLMVLSTALFEKPAFKNLICNGLVLAEDGKKMSKKLRNYPPPLEVIDEYGADAVRLYLINSPVVRAETLRFKKEGVLGVVKDVFLPWYNAYRFLVQNAKRLETEGGGPFVPADLATLQSANVLDQWIHSATQSLVRTVRREMKKYQLYTVVPHLLKFLDSLTNVYVRFNRKRLKGRTGEDDCHTALSTLFNVLLTTCKVMAPFTPFFTETLYQNLRKACKGSEESVHYCTIPPKEGKEGKRIEDSVTRMMKIIDLARNIRERNKLPLKTPLKEMIVVHPDAEFLNDITGVLREYVLEELNVRSLVPCNDTLKYASLKAEPDFSVLGKRLGKSMGLVAKEVKEMSQKDILTFEEAGEVTIANHSLKREDIKIVRVFKRPDDLKDNEIDAAGDGDVLVVLDLRADDSLVEAGFAREIVNRIQKLRKKSGLEPTDTVDVYFESLDEDESVSKQVLVSQEQNIKDSIGSPLLLSTLMPSHAVIIADETFTPKETSDESVKKAPKLSYKISLARPALKFNEEAILALYSGDVKSATGLQTYLLSRDHSNLKSEFQAGDGKITVSCVENLPAVTVVLGEHLHLSVGDDFLSKRNA